MIYSNSLERYIPHKIAIEVDYNVFFLAFTSDEEEMIKTKQKSFEVMKMQCAKQGPGSHCLSFIGYRAQG